MTIEQDYIDQLVVTPTGIDIVHVEFDVIRSPSIAGSQITEVDVATTVYHLNMRIKKGDILIIYNVCTILNQNLTINSLTFNQKMD